MTIIGREISGFNLNVNLFRSIQLFMIKVFVIREANEENGWGDVDSLQSQVIIVTT